MSLRLDNLKTALETLLGPRAESVESRRGELTLVVSAGDYHAAMSELRDRAELRFETLIDLCGVDYSSYADGAWTGRRFAAVSHLLSLAHNWRLRVRTFAPNDEFPVLDSVVDLWPGASWYEREAFDLYGIMFSGHDDLRRILTDYGFIGHPFRKDFPLSGNVEMRYDPEQRRVIYQPVSIEPREITPRIVREGTYGDLGEK